ncbi:hypothetical protein PR202_ga13830 [Eleusine coracana subsp. coracana]|uniref:FHA domain-containing protein n=1 Tax=Eleusine coracana subsp. coracana TaxID=191504 RepID=A0AAV5CFZ3_ELECO|nr:hypothetical protein PR202_ga13830 [Eleusine coracana subsp. coracana]
MSSVSCYGQASASYNGGHVYPGMNGHSFHTKPAESMAGNGDPTNIVPYGYSDVGQMFERHAYGAKNHGSGEGNNASLKGMPDFEDPMQFQHLDSNECGNRVAESKTLVIPNQVGGEHAHFDNNVQEHMPLQVTGQPESSQGPCGTIWSGVQARDTLTFSEVKKLKSEKIETPSHFENFLNSPSDANQEDLDDPESKGVPGVGSTMQTLAQPEENNMSFDQIDPGHVKNNLADISSIILVSASLEVPCPGRYFECILNTEDPEIPCNDDVATPSEYPQCSTSAFGQNSENATCSGSPVTSPRPNPEHSKSSDLAPVKLEDVANVQPPSQKMKLSPSTSEQKEGSVAPNDGVVEAKPSEGASAAGVLVTCKIDTNDVNTCMLALPSFGSGGFVPVPDQMQFNPHDNRQELGDVATLPNCMPSNALSDLGIEDHVATVPTPVQAEVCSDNENDIPNYYDLEALILNQDLIPWDQDTDFMHPEVTRFQHPESRKSLIRLEQGARSYLNRAIMSYGAFAVIYGLHLKYYIKDPEFSYIHQSLADPDIAILVILGRETEDVKVDIDLGKEGRANKISRRQAVIKMDEAGSFHIKNIGKCPIFVNSKEIPSCKRINLSSDSLIEIKDMRFIFHVNPDAVKQYLSHYLKPER